MTTHYTHSTCRGTGVRFCQWCNAEFDNYADILSHDCREQLWELAKKLRKYARHLTGCPADLWDDDCTCGFEEIGQC